MTFARSLSRTKLRWLEFSLQAAFAPHDNKCSLKAGLQHPHRDLSKVSLTHRVWSLSVKYQSPLLAFLIALSISQSSRLDAAPAIPGYQRFHDDDAMKSSLGALLAGELNCLSCHSAEENVTAGVSTKQAPNLMGIGARVKPDYLRKYIADPIGAKPGTTMPDLMHGLSGEESKQQVEALVHFLLSLTIERLSQDEALIGARRRGETLYNDVGCVACHDSKGDNGVSLPTSVAHGDLDAKYTLGGLAGFLKNPLQSRPSGRMPSLNLTQREAQDIAAFLLPNVPERAGAAYAVYRGNWQRLPNFDELTPVRRGSGEGITASVGERNHFGLRWDAKFAVPKTGKYRFHFGADDGARLSVDGKMIIDNDGIHGVVWKKKRIRLTEGAHDLQIDYFEQAGGEELYLEIEGPGLDRTTLDSLFVGTSDGHAEIEHLKVNTDLVRRGRQLFHSVGCANCHEVAESIASPGKTLATAFAKLQLNHGCLAETVRDGIPDYELSAEQRKTLTEFIKTAKAGTTSTDAIHATMLNFNCYACHARDEIGGIESARNKSFKTTQPEMG